jgi:hypothetical protein
MSDERTRALRMRSQRLDGRASGVAELVRHVVGIQAQEPRAAALSIRARTEGVTNADVESAIAGERSIVRAWAMRGTIHLVASEDAGWLHDLLAPLARPAEHRVLDGLGVPREARARAVGTISRALADHGPMTRAELCAELERKGIDTSGRRAAHLPRLAALDGHLCFGPRRGGKDTYVLIDDWLGERPRLEREEALAELARRYAAAYWPAEEGDFRAWSGLPASDSRAGWQHVLAAPPPTPRVAPPRPPIVRLLPAFDTYLLGYRSRELAVPDAFLRAVWPGGGIVRPTVVANGRAVATWRVERVGERLDVAVEPFGREPDVSEEAADVVRFLAAR